MNERVARVRRIFERSVCMVWYAVRKDLCGAGTRLSVGPISCQYLNPGVYPNIQMSICRPSRSDRLLTKILLCSGEPLQHEKSEREGGRLVRNKLEERTQKERNATRRGASLRVHGK